MNSGREKLCEKKVIYDRLYAKFLSATAFLEISQRVKDIILPLWVFQLSEHFKIIFYNTRCKILGLTKRLFYDYVINYLYI